MRAWALLTGQIGCNDSNLLKTLKNSQYIYFDLGYRISKALDEDFFSYGSQKLQETRDGNIHHET